MLFKQFTKTAVIAISLLLWLSACTSNLSVENKVGGGDDKEKAKTSAVDGQNNAEQSIEGIEGTDVSQTGKANHAGKNTNQQSKRIPAINLYLQQQVTQPINVPTDVLKDYQEAISLMKNKKWQKAQILLDKVILEQPQLSGSYVNKAIIAQQQKKLEEAHALLDTAISMNNLNLYAHHLQGQIYRTQGQFDKAEQSYLAALAIWPDFSDAQVSMAILLELYRGRLLDAHGYYASYLLLNSDDEEVKRWQAGLEIKIKRAGLEIPVTEIVIPEEEKSVSEGVNKQTESINSAQVQNND